MELKSISRRVSRAMIKGAAAAQKANLIASTRRVVPFNYIRGDHLLPGHPTTHYSPPPDLFEDPAVFFSFPCCRLLERIFQFYTLAKRKGVSTTATENRSQLIVIVRGSWPRVGGIFTEKNSSEIISLGTLKFS